MSTKKFSVALASVAAALTLAACGGGGGGNTTVDDTLHSLAIATAPASTKPSETENLVEMLNDTPSVPWAPAVDVSDKDLDRIAHGVCDAWEQGKTQAATAAVIKDQLGVDELSAEHFNAAANIVVCPDQRPEE